MLEFHGARAILSAVGGAENIVSAAHCATRLRLVLKNPATVDKTALGKIDAVKGTFSSGGQFQIVIGQGAVKRVFDDLIALGVKSVSVDEAKADAAANLNILQRLARLLSNIFVPIIPVIVACGLLMGALGMAKTVGWMTGQSSLFQLLNIVSNTAFVFLPILVAFSAAREFRVSPFMAAALGGIMIHPDLQNAWTVGTGIKEYWDLFGIPVAKLGYQVAAVTGRPQEADYLRQLGAAQVLDRAEFTSPGKPLAKERWAGAVDTVGSHTLANVCASIKYRGAVAACGLASGMDFPSTVAPFILRGVALVGVDSVMCPREERLQAWQRLATDLDAGKLALMTHEIGLADALTAAQQLLQGQIRGRLVVRLDAVA